MKGRAAKGVDVGPRGRLADGDLAGAGSRRERIRDHARPLCDERAHMRQADPTLTGAETRPRRSLEELQFVVAAVERLLEIRKCGPHAGAYHAIGRRRRRQRVRLGGGPDHRHRRVGGRHPGEDIAPDAADRRRRIHRHAALRGDGRRSGREPGVERRLAERHHVHGACRHDDLLGADVEHPAGFAGDDRRPRVDPHHVDAVARIQRHHAAPRAFGIGRCLRPASAATNDRDLDLDAPDGDLMWRDRRREIGRGCDGEQRLAVDRVRPHFEPGSRPHLAGALVGDAVDLGDAVAAVAREAHATATRPDPRTDHRDGDGVSGLECEGPPVDDDTSDHGLRRRRRGVRHQRIRRPCGSNSGSGWSRAGRLRPMISISKRPPSASDASELAAARRRAHSSAGT